MQTCQFLHKMYCPHALISQSSSLKLTRLEITGKQQFVCDLCAKSFLKRRFCVLHMKTHTGENPFSCDFCVKAFSRRSSLVVHMKTHTGEKSLVCDTCA